jgi:hypothetical protein
MVVVSVQKNKKEIGRQFNQWLSWINPKFSVRLSILAIRFFSETGQHKKACGIWCAAAKKTACAAKQILVCAIC